MAEGKDNTKDRAGILKSADDAALVAETEYDILREKYQDATNDIQNFMKKHYMTTGYIRLARIIMNKEK